MSNSSDMANFLNKFIQGNKDLATSNNFEELFAELEDFIDAGKAPGDIDAIDAVKCLFSLFIKMGFSGKVVIEIGKDTSVLGLPTYDETFVLSGKDVAEYNNPDFYPELIHEYGTSNKDLILNKLSNPSNYFNMDRYFASEYPEFAEYFKKASIEVKDQ